MVPRTRTRPGRQSNRRVPTKDGASVTNSAPNLRRSRRRFTLAAWIVAGVFAVLGIVVSVVTESWWPMLLFLGFAVPLLPLGTARRR